MAPGADAESGYGRTGPHHRPTARGRRSGTAGGIERRDANSTLSGLPPDCPARGEPAWAKVNLYLHVVGRRPDGYHLLDSLAVFAAIADDVSVVPAAGWSLELTGPDAAGLSAGPDNLVLRAAAALAARYPGPPGRLTLHKRLPVAAGIGGGSADAAATLRLLSRWWEVATDLGEIAAGLGADVPVCLASRPARMAGIGERLGYAPTLPPFGIALVNPGVGLSTQTVFAARDGAWSGAADLPAAWPHAAAMAADLSRLRNDLEAPARRLAPRIDAALDGLAAAPGCLLARMSGSGATCFGLFATPAAAAEAAHALARPGWWSWGGGTASLPGPEPTGN